MPYDFTDSGDASAKSDQDRWNDAVDRWRSSVDGADRLSFSVIRGGRIVDELTREVHAGRRAYWFGALELTDEWLLGRLEESINAAGERYTPKADTPSAIDDDLDAVTLDPRFLDDLKQRIDRTLRACRQDVGIWSPDATADAALTRLRAWSDRVFGRRVDPDVDVLPTAEPDLGSLREIATAVVDAVRARGDVASPSGRRNIHHALDAAASLRAATEGRRARLCAERVLAIEGSAGQGKTHSLIARAKVLIDSGTPAS